MLARQKGTLSLSKWRTAENVLYVVPSVPRYEKTEADCTPYDKKRDLDGLRQNIEDKGIARQHCDTLEKRGISVDDFINPSKGKDLKNIQYYRRVSLYPGRLRQYRKYCIQFTDVIDSSREFLLPLKINTSIKQKFLVCGEINAGITEFSRSTYESPGHEWDALLSNWIKRNRFPVIPNSHTLEDEEVAHRLISYVELQHDLTFLDSKLPLFGFTREVAKDQKKRPKLYLWQGEADAIAYSCALEKYVIVDFKVVDNLLDYCKKKTDLCGKHLHQCLVYAKLLQLHMKLHYLPPCPHSSHP